jgi:Domain of unknown function (DUF4383)
MSQSPNRLLGIVFGIVYLLIGILGFFITSSTGFVATSGPKLLGLFEINPLHNVAHLVIGAALLLAGLSSARAAKALNSTIGAVYLLLGVVGLFLSDGNNPLNILALNGADNVLHFASAVVLLAVGIGADRTLRGPKTV